jgi:predicted flap endonuclease-1-like 5' DNA nuclease
MFEQAVTAGPGTGTYTQHTFEILIMLLGAFLLGLWLGWLLWSKYKQQVETLQLENQSLKGSLTTVNTDLALEQNKAEMLAVATTQLEAEKSDLLDLSSSLTNKVDSLEESLEVVSSDKAQIENTLVNAMASTPESAAVPMEIVHSPVDLHVEDLAIGAPAVAALAVAAPEAEVEAPTVAAEPEPVVSAPVSEVIEIVEAPIVEAPVVEVTAPVVETTAPEVELDARYTGVSADLLAEGGIDVPDAPATEVASRTIEMPIEAAPVEATKAAVAPAVAIPVVSAALSSAPDNLKLVEGIGPKIEEILNKNQVFSFAQLAATPVSRIKEMLIAEGNRFAMHDPATWPAQALLAANAEWENLKAYQTYLNSGKKPD